jgi:hypothetical protein
VGKQEEQNSEEGSGGKSHEQVQETIKENINEMYKRG